jgi:hypothetical protein
MSEQDGTMTQVGTGFHMMALCLALIWIGLAFCLGCGAPSDQCRVEIKSKLRAKKPGVPARAIPQWPMREGDALPPEHKSTAFKVVDRILEKMQLGNIAFNVPSSMNLAETSLVQLVLSLEKPIEELKQIIEAQGEREGARIRVSKRMEARLTGTDFQITAITPECQAIAGNELTKWKWEIKPVKPGHSRLHLTLNAFLTVEGISTARTVCTFDKYIDVNVTLHQKAIDFIGKNWQWLWAAIIIPVVGWLWRRRKKYSQT